MRRTRRTSPWPEWENWVANDRPSTATERAVFGPAATAKATVIDWSGGGTWDAASILFNSGDWEVNQQNPASRLVLHGSIPGWDHTIIDNTATSGTNTIGTTVDYTIPAGDSARFTRLKLTGP